MKKLQQHGYKIRTGNNLIGKANTYKVMNLQPRYVEGKEVDLNEAEDKLSEEDFNELLFRCKGVAYFYADEEKYSHRKALPLLIEKESGKIRCFSNN